MAAIRELLKLIFSLNSHKEFFPHINVTFDKQLFPLFSQCLQYKPQKSAKFRIKFWIFCDVYTNYVFRAFLNTGKTNQIEEGLDNHVVMKLMSPYFDTGPNVRTEKFLQAFLLPTSSKKLKITMFGTVGGDATCGNQKNS